MPNKTGYTINDNVVKYAKEIQALTSLPENMYE